MARFAGKVGYLPSASESPADSGVWASTPVEYTYRGDVVRLDSTPDLADKVNDDFTVGNLISIVADAFANQNFAHIKYVEWMGGRWIVTQVFVQPPRLILTLGGVYNGVTP